MEKLKASALTGLILAPLFLDANVKTSFAFDRPLHSATIVLAIVGCTLILISRQLPSQHHGHRPDQEYTPVPLDDIVGADTPRTPSPITIVSHPASPRHLRIVFALLVFALSLRAELGRRMVQNIQCPANSYTMLIPLSLAALDFLLSLRPNSYIRGGPSQDEVENNVYDVAWLRLVHSRPRFIVPAALFSLSAYFILNSDPTPASTYICPVTTSARTVSYIVSLLAFPTDLAIFMCIDRFSYAFSTSRRTGLQTNLSLVAYAALTTSVLLVSFGLGWLLAVPDDRSWMLNMPQGFFWSIMTLSLLTCIMVSSLCIAVYFFGAMGTAATIIFVTTVSASMIRSGEYEQPFPPYSETPQFLSFLLLLLGFTLMLTAPPLATTLSSRLRPLFTHTPAWFYGLVVILIITRSLTGLSHTVNSTYHPIDLLMFQAKASHERYAAEAATSTSLHTAIDEYKKRHNRHPPPNFPQWYEYAVSRDAHIIDEFDQINHDLLPFWSLSPAEIRERTWQAIANPWNDVAGISIRNGTVEISPNVMPTHRWMLDGIIEMITPFSGWLPDMDLAFNVNDECRVASSFEAMKQMENVAKQSQDMDGPVKNAFSEDRTGTWSPIPEEPIRETPFKELSFQRTFFGFGNAACEPNSAARSERHWNTGRICASCADRHSLGVFLSNWTLSGDICHQPDMADLHGFYLSPAAFKGTHELYPIFSQSKAHGYNDILYPSAWNYVEKVKYKPTKKHPDPPFEQKTRKLFWRGATSEGVSPGSGTWKGMSRQRFTHLLNNVNNNDDDNNKKTADQTTPVLLSHPFAPSRNKYKYEDVPVSQLKRLIPVDAHIVDTIARCGGPDCPTQTAELAPLVTPSDFQAHWAHKFLLDLDGAGFSGRFLPFLQSNSLPFKAALFREWHASRLTPWVHFVPLDLRGHGFWASLLYFAGLDGVVLGRRVSVAPHEYEAAYIAASGRAWAERVLRKEDMEIYFFRLLLEWGRVTDDARDELGYRFGG